MGAHQKAGVVRFEEGKRSSRRLFGRRRNSNKPAPEPEHAPSLLSDKFSKFQPSPEEEDGEYLTRTMYVHPRAKSKKQFKPKKEIVLQQPPSARQAAFGGAVRYDWIDIETRAAIKIQAAYRRNKVMNDIENQGASTGAIRNRARRRNAESANHFFDCCGTNFSFADFASHDREAHREYQKLIYNEKKKARFQKEEEMRVGFSQLWNLRRSQRNQLDEAFEIVE